MSVKRHLIQKFKTLSVLCFAVCLPQMPMMAASFFHNDSQPISTITWDKYSLIVDGKRIVPAAGEIHYSRVPADEWEKSIRNMKEGGIDIVACYVFWNHIEEIQNQFDWSGQRNLRHFLEICKNEQMPVILRIGPFCHGEVRMGGIPDWVVESGCELRSMDSTFLKYTGNLYNQIFTQVKGLQWKDRGPVIACQFDNEFGGDGKYLLTLKKMAEDAGFDLPFYTYTGWPGLSKPMPYGEMIPLYGDYADGFWDRETTETSGEYYKAFNFHEFRASAAIASEQLDYSNASTDSSYLYPYFTCELGGGMMTSYHRRIYTYPNDAYAMAVVKLGSGSNLLGYYMYHGGTNPVGKLSYLNETQTTPFTNWNELPVKTYDFQAPLGEFGQKSPHYYLLRKLHLFMQDYGVVLAPMTAKFPCRQDLPKGDDKNLRWSYRSSMIDGLESGFIFVNNYERLQSLSAKRNVKFQLGNVKFPTITIPAGVSCIFPVNIDDITYATAQIIAKRDKKIFLEKIEGIPCHIQIGSKILKNVEPNGPSKPIYGNIYLLTPNEAATLFLTNEKKEKIVVPEVKFERMNSSRANFPIRTGVSEVAIQPSDEDFEKAASYKIALPDIDRTDCMIRIDYNGDVARLYANGQLVADNFYNGRSFLFGLWRLPQNCDKLEMRIIPRQKTELIYYPREAGKHVGEKIQSISIVKFYGNFNL